MLGTCSQESAEMEYMTEFGKLLVVCNETSTSKADGCENPFPFVDCFGIYGSFLVYTKCYTNGHSFIAPEEIKTLGYNRHPQRTVEFGCGVF